ncbi:hypothetical protein N7453_010823 [Penicillium expansum]|nr:hypothetical protein N7453_010823 [Penicillium expansum]
MSSSYAGSVYSDLTLTPNLALGPPHVQTFSRLTTSSPQLRFFKMALHADKPTALEQTASGNTVDILDPAARRRLQNRLNQRASRKKKALEFKKQQKPAERKWVVYIGDSNIPKKNASTKEEEATSHQCNVLRAMLINADLLGLTFELLNEDLASQFNLSGPLMSAVHLPASLFPSQKQRKIIHHPWVDLIPILSLREALLVRTDVIDEDEVCGDFYGACAPSQEVGLRVWGEAWDPSAYELSETFIRKWSWIITECPDIIKSSNHWRKQRGEKPIVFTKIK